VTSPRSAAASGAWTVIAAAIVLASLNCGGSSAAPSIAPAALHGEAADAIGDTIAGSVPVPPDLVHATVDVASGNITFLIQLAPGTLDRQTTRVEVLLDTDQSSSTGIRQLNDLGADYSIELVASASQATISRADAIGCAAFRSCYVSIGSAPIASVQDGMQTTFPLSLLGNDDGRLSFQVFSSAFVRLSPSPLAPLTAVTFDAMPNEAAPAARVQ
jgi:hypothetical protein